MEWVLLCFLVGVGGFMCLLFGVVVSIIFYLKIIFMCVGK